jgi:large subunit ribosomal protein L6
MSRVAKAPVDIPRDVEVNITERNVGIKGAKGELSHQVHELVTVESKKDQITVTARDESKQSRALSGTTRALLANIVTGVSKGFERKLEIVGVGFRARTQGKTLNLSLGYSHPIDFEIPEGITIEVPSQNEIIVRGIDKQRVGQVAANIRSFRKPEPYKGKGIRYSDEHVVRKEAKKT